MTVFVNKGDKALTDAELAARTQHYIDRDWPQWKRERATRLGGAKLTALNTYMAQVATDTDTNRATNLFNQQLADYRKAVARLAQVELSVGRKAYTEKVPTGEQVWDEKLMQMVDVMQTIKHPAIDPVPATIDSVDEQGNPITVPNPGVVKDEEERAAAQAVSDATPKAVKAFK